MLFSREDVSSFINLYFEPVWQSVRPVPLVRIDFGNQNVITRTMHGNIATYACASNGAVLDVIPGIYTPDVYLNRLNQMRLLAGYLAQSKETSRSQRLLLYHHGQIEALRKNQPRPRFIETAGVTKARIEKSVQIALVAGSSPEGATPASFAPPGLLQDSEIWKLLIEDTRQNENNRRRLVHEMLASAGRVQPDQIVGRLYKEVLHTDLADPHLGLDEVLFAHYPFAKEDGAR